MVLLKCCHNKRTNFRFSCPRIYQIHVLTGQVMARICVVQIQAGLCGDSNSTSSAKRVCVVVGCCLNIYLTTVFYTHTLDTNMYIC